MGEGGYSGLMISLEVAQQRLTHLGGFDDLMPALLAQVDFLNKRKNILEQDLTKPHELLSSMAHEMAESFKPRAQFESGYFTGDSLEEIRHDLASEGADIVAFGLSALVSANAWSDNELYLIKDSMAYAQELAVIGQFDLSKETEKKIKETNEKHYPDPFFRSGADYQVSRRICRSLRHYFGSDFWEKMGEVQVAAFLRDVALSPNGSVPSSWKVEQHLDHDKYGEFKAAAKQFLRREHVTHEA